MHARMHASSHAASPPSSPKVGDLLDADEEAAAREAALSAGALSEASELLEQAVAAAVECVPAQARLRPRTACDSL